MVILNQMPSGKAATIGVQTQNPWLGFKHSYFLFDTNIRSRFLPFYKILSATKQLITCGVTEDTFGAETTTDRFVRQGFVSG